MKKYFAGLFSLLILLAIAPSAMAAPPDIPYQTSPWAYEDVRKAAELELIPPNTFDDLRPPIQRGSFAATAAHWLALEFGSNLQSYLLIMNYRGQAAEGEDYMLRPVDVALDLGIIEGRGNGDLEQGADITRQEAAVMLARAYRVCHQDVPDTLAPLSFADTAEIDDWALADVQLMNHLGIMTGVGGNCFDPLGSYTAEQCIVTLLRLHEKAPCDGNITTNPFTIPAMEGGFMRQFEKGDFVFAAETKDYYICIRSYRAGTVIGNHYYFIDIIDQDLTLREYPTAILRASSSRGPIHARPENPVLSADGTKLCYTATLKEDAYRTVLNADGTWEDFLLFPKGIYTVTMDLKSGEQTYTRAELSPN